MRPDKPRGRPRQVAAPHKISDHGGGTDVASVPPASGYGLHIFPKHAELLEKSAISPDVARARGYVSVDTGTRLGQLAHPFAKSQRVVPGLLIPIYGTDGELRLHQYRPDNPRLSNGKPNKYETPWRHGICLDVPRGALAAIGDPAVPLWITEGARKADAAVSAGLCCIALIGVDGWQSKGVALPDWKDVWLKDREVLIGYDSDVMTKDGVRGALDGFTTWLDYRGAKVRHVILPPGPDGAKVGLDDYLAAAGHTVAGLRQLARDPGQRATAAAVTSQPVLPPAAPCTLDQTVATFRKWLHLDDPAPLYALAAALVANRAPGDPVWLLLVCAPSTGKTELLSAAVRLPWVRPASTLTASSLLSGTSAKDRAKDATGGVLRQIGDFGVLLCKDFTSLLAQNRDTRAEVLAALREIYDGSWDRAVGTDGGKVLHWHGKCGLVGGVTPALDRYHAVVAALGDRFLLLRMPDPDPGKSGAMALTHRGHEKQMRSEMADALAGLVASADVTAVNRELAGAEQAELIRLASFTARARTGVERDGYTRDLLYLPQIEGPGRLVTAYARLLGALAAIGCDDATAWGVLGRVAIDCMPAIRARFARELLGVPGASTSDLAAAAGMVSKNAREHLEDLALLGLAGRTKTSGAANAADYWMATDLLRDLWPESRTEMYLPSPNPSIEALASSPVSEQDAHEPTGPSVHLGSTFGTEWPADSIGEQASQ
jgi:Domain of unknown function (DUF3854)